MSISARAARKVDLGFTVKLATSLVVNSLEKDKDGHGCWEDEEVQEDREEDDRKAKADIQVISFPPLKELPGGPPNAPSEITTSRDGNGASGICPGYRSRIVGNLCYDNEHIGIHAGRGCTITDNNTSENGQSGIISYCGSLVSHNCVYMNNHSKDQNHAGIIVMDGCFIQDNVLRENHINNIFVKGTGNTIQNNQISSLDHPGNAILLLSKDNKCIANQTHGDDPVFSRLDEINRKTE